MIRGEDINPGALDPLFIFSFAPEGFRERLFLWKINGLLNGSKILDPGKLNLFDLIELFSSKISRSDDEKLPSSLE